ncbi:tetratricopeptide repeat protein [Nocardia inohanensis]|uniref:tetratricopeptide repeat protein n=1 Tax=Nocardia inohanensis TaxID=209246 RepID=UPI000AF71210|nr:tetratricopeptide repeat protein [Nocardia inohanensis]
MAVNGDSDVHGADARKELRRILVATGLRENELLEPLATELRARGCRPRKAWRLANELTQQEVADEFNRLTGKPSAPMKASRISEYESWPGVRGAARNRPRPTVEVLRYLATIYRTSWDQLVDTMDLVAMPSGEVLSYRDAVAERCTASPRGHGMPSAAMIFIGRQHELAVLGQRVREQLASNRPVVQVVNGLAGTGKTALVRRLIEEFAGAYPDGCIWEDLRGHSEGRAPRTPTGVLEQLLLRRGVHPETIEADLTRRAERWQEEMRDKRMLIVFDNVLESKQIRDLIPNAPGCFVLITSRHKLTGLTGAAPPLQLDAMPRAEAEELLVTLSHLPPDYDVQAVRRILETAGRLPLALRLIAGQLAHGGADMLAAADQDFQELSDRLRRASAAEESPAADILARFSAEGETLRAAFELSYQRLPDAELRRAVRLLGWFPGSEISAETLAAIGDMSVANANVLIRRIFEVGLLDPAESGPRGPRYRIHDVTRLFARTQAALEDLPGDHAAAIGRLIRYSLRIAGMVGAPRPFDLAGTFPNPLNADDDAKLREARTWLTREREMLLGCVRAAGSGAETGKLARLLASHLSGLGHWTDARWLFVRALDITRGTGDRVEQCDVLYGLGTVHRLACDYDIASRCFKEAHAIASATSDPLRMASALWGYAEVTRHIGDYPHARDAYADVLAIARQLENPKFEGDALRGLGHLERTGGDKDTARIYYDAALAIALEIDDSYSRGWSLWGIGDIHRKLADFDTARAQFDEALEIAREIQDSLLQADALRGMGHIERDRKDLDAAQGFYSESLAVARRYGDPHGEADAWRALAHNALAFGRKHHPRARDFLQRALTLYEGMGVKVAEQVRRELDELDAEGAATSPTG